MPLPSRDKVYRWEYTLLAGDLFDDGREPPPVTLATHASRYPSVVLEADPPRRTAYGSGPWWLPQDLAIGGEVIDAVLRVARDFGMLPVIEADHLAAEAGGNIELIESYELRFPADLGAGAVEAARLSEVRRTLWKLLSSGEAPDVSLADVATAINNLLPAQSGAFEVRARLVSLRHRKPDAARVVPARAVTIAALIIDSKSFGALPAVAPRSASKSPSGLKVTFETELSRRLGGGPIEVDAEFARDYGLSRARHGDIDSDSGAVVWLKRAAGVGDPESMFFLGVIRKNEGNDEGPDGSLVWFRQAAEKGHAEASYVVGLYKMSRDEPSGEDGGVRWWRQAADLGSIEAMYQLGIFYNSEGDETEAEALWRSAAANDHDDAMFRLGRLISDRVGSQGSPAWYELEGDDSPEQWWQQAAARGSADAMLSLGMRRTFLGRFSGENGALEWFTKSYEAGKEDAAFMIGMVRRKEGAIDGPDGALAWLTRTADQGNPMAMVQIGEIHHARGDLDGEDGAEAWYRRAAALGDAKAMFWVGSVLAQRAVNDGLSSTGLHELTGEDTPEIWWSRSAEAGSPDAMFNLGVLRFQQRQLAGPDGAVAWWQQAAEAGHEGALDQLRRLKQMMDEARRDDPSA